MMNNPYHVMIVDDHAMFRAGIRALIDAENDYEVIAEASDGLEAMQQAARLKPHLVITDLSMPGINGTEAIISIKNRSPETKILALTVHKAEEYIFDALLAGADGYILKDDTQEELVNAIRQILSGKTYLSASISKNIVEGYLRAQNSTENPKHSWEKLTQRELQILKLIAEGKKNKDIASFLSISIKTVEKHRSNLMRKLDLHDISSLTTYALQNGIALVSCVYALFTSSICWPTYINENAAWLII